MNYLEAFKLILFCLAFWVPPCLLLVYLKKKIDP